MKLLTTLIKFATSRGITSVEEAILRFDEELDERALSAYED